MKSQLAAAEKGTVAKVLSLKPVYRKEKRAKRVARSPQ